jgi:pimeloyl-ACP methyl ester carboxylesterase
MTVRPFTVAVPQPVLDDLHDRLSRTRFLDDSPRRPESGMTTAYLRELVLAWQTFDWRTREAWLNGHAQFLADVDGATLHFAHRRSADPDAPALLVMHGWPHTYALQLDFADLLPDLDVVVVSLPGFAFSPPLDEPVTEQRVAGLVHTLMTDVLGYTRYLTYGEDVTANVSDLVAATHPEAVTGIVVTHAHFLPQDERESTSDPVERAFYDRMAGGVVPAGGLRPRAGHPARHPRRRAERLARWPARVDHREARRVE